MNVQVNIEHDRPKGTSMQGSWRLLRLGSQRLLCAAAQELAACRAASGPGRETSSAVAKDFGAQGRWRLLWTSDQSDFARLRRRVRPLPAESVQLIGVPGGLPEDRAANVITVARALTVELSSGGLCAPPAPPHEPA